MHWRASRPPIPSAPAAAAPQHETTPLILHPRPSRASRTSSCSSVDTPAASAAATATASPTRAAWRSALLPLLPPVRTAAAWLHVGLWACGTRGEASRRRKGEDDDNGPPVLPLLPLTAAAGGGRERVGVPTLGEGTAAPAEEAGASGAEARRGGAGPARAGGRHPGDPVGCRASPAPPAPGAAALVTSLSTTAEASCASAWGPARSGDAECGAEAARTRPARPASKAAPARGGVCAGDRAPIAAEVGGASLP